MMYTNWSHKDFVRRFLTAMTICLEHLQGKALWEWPSNDVMRNLLMMEVGYSGQESMNFWIAYKEMYIENFIEAKH